ncbi:MAG: hypothetical protein HRU35_04100 [Rickettsiaceae bacterium]|nr:hypothetical protein [Rickettsiaceae bacterium]
MVFNLDIAIFIIFVIVTLIIGILSGRGVVNISQFALGGRNFSTITLSATIIATWMSGGVFFNRISETYSHGLHFIIPMLGDSFIFVLLAYFLIPRMGEFLGKLSIAEAVDYLYGRHARLIIAIMGIISCSGVIAIQFRVSGVFMEILFGISSFYATLISAMVVIFYSTFGGIRAVTFTDIIQFCAFAVIIPIVTFAIWKNFNDTYTITTVLSGSKLYNYKEVFNYENPRFFKNLSIFLFFILPHMNPTLFQRISMAQNINQAIKAFLIAAVICFIIEGLLCWLGVLLFTSESGLNKNNLIPFLLDSYSNPGFKGLVIAGVMAMIMSTSDSYINSSSVMFSHDVCNYFKTVTRNWELFLSRFFSVLVGVIAFALALKPATILDLAMMTLGFYNSVLTIPFLLAVFCFRSSPKSFLIAAFSAMFISIMWRVNFSDTGIDPMIPAMLANLIGLFCSHYLLKQPGGWVGIKDGGMSAKLQAEKKLKWQRRIQELKEFNLLRFCLKNRPPSEVTYPLFALFAIASTYSGMFTIDETIRSAHADILDKFFHSVIILSSIFLTYPIWPASLKNHKFIGVTWNLSLFYILIFVTSFQLIISKFGAFQAMILMMNIIILGLISRWYISLFMTVVGIIISVQFFKLYMGVDILPGSMGSIKFQLMYILLLSSSALLIFLRPNQKEFVAFQDKNDNCNQELSNLKFTMENTKDTKNELFRNVPHESNTPLTGIVSLVELLYKNFNNLDFEDLHKYFKDVVSCNERLKTYTRNLTDLAKLTTGNCKFDIADVNLGELIYKRIEICKNLYLTDAKKESLNLYLNANSEVIFPCDKELITKVIDNIVINAIKYSNDGEINIVLSKDKKTGKILFTVSDQGIGVPENELKEIFMPFTVSTRTKTQAGGRGVGLAVANEIIKLHKGKIWVENNKTKGSKFFVELG